MFDYALMSSRKFILFNVLRRIEGYWTETTNSVAGILFDWFRDREPRNIKTSSHISDYHMETHLASFMFKRSVSRKADRGHGFLSPKPNM